jgi:hypothetical protein
MRNKTEKDRELCQSFVSNVPLSKANRRIADAETSVNSNAFIKGLPKMRVLNVARVGQTLILILLIGKMHKQGFLSFPSCGDDY